MYTERHLKGTWDYKPLYHKPFCNSFTYNLTILKIHSSLQHKKKAKYAEKKMKSSVSTETFESYTLLKIFFHYKGNLAGSFQFLRTQDVMYALDWISTNSPSIWCWHVTGNNHYVYRNAFERHLRLQTLIPLALLQYLYKQRNNS